MALLLALPLAQSQDNTFSVMPFAGLTLANAHPEIDLGFDPKYRTGFFAGASLNFPIASKWSLPVDVQYAQRGFFYNTPGAFVQINNQTAVFRGRIDYRLGYLDFAPRLEFWPVQGLGISAGAYLGFRLSESVRYGDLIEWTNTKDLGLFESSDFGLTGRLSGAFGPLTVFAAYQFGLSNISNLEYTDDNGQSLGNLGLNNRSVFVGVGWRL